MYYYWCYIIIFFFYICINIVFYYLKFPSWAYPTLAISLVISDILLKDYLQSDSPATKQQQQHSIATAPSENYFKELQIARRVQQGLLSVGTPQLNGIKLAKRCLSAKNIGGDFYTFIDKNKHSLRQKPKNIPGVIEYVDARETYFDAIIGDVAGHGVSSALVMALSSGLLSEISKNNNSPAKTLKLANNDLLKYIENSQISYVTAFYASINTYSKKLRYSKAGHLPALLFHKDNTCTQLDANGIFLGMFPDEEYEEAEVQLETGDRLFLYTDGIIEARNNHNEEFGLNRFTSLIRSNQKTDINTLLDTIFEETKKFTEFQDVKDDQTLIIMEIA